MRYILIVLLVVLFSCKEKLPEQIPDYVIPKDKMAEVMVDIHLIEASMSLNVVSSDSSAAFPVNALPDIDIFKKYNITKSQYDTSYVYYTQHPKQFGEVYDMVLNEISKMQANISNGKIDSINTNVETAKKPFFGKNIKKMN